MICPDCKSYNYSGQTACTKCGADLYGRRVDDTQKKQSRSLIRVLLAGLNVR